MKYCFQLLLLGSLLSTSIIVSHLEAIFSSLALFKIIFLSLMFLFQYYIPNVNLFLFILVGMKIYVWHFIISGSFPIIISLYIVFFLLPLFPPSGIPVSYMLGIYLFFHVS